MFSALWHRKTAGRMRRHAWQGGGGGAGSGREGGRGDGGVSGGVASVEEKARLLQLLRLVLCLPACPSRPHMPFPFAYRDSNVGTRVKSLPVGCVACGNIPFVSSRIDSHRLFDAGW